MKTEEIRTILVAGAGTMGLQIGLHFAAGGHEVKIYDISDDVLDKSRKQLDRWAGRMIRAGRYTREIVDEAMHRTTFTARAEEAAENTDLISESVPENPELKGRVFARFNELCGPETIFTTNTSTLLPSMFAEATGRPERFCAFHFHDLMVTDVVDVMPHPGTDPDVTALVTAFAEKNGLTPILMKKENTGYVFNYMLMDLLGAALTLAQREIVDIPEIDRAWNGVMRSPSGPFAIMDAIGLDTVYTVCRYWASKTEDTQALANAAFLKTYVEAGKTGVKSGEGFYRYPIDKGEKR